MDTRRILQIVLAAILTLVVVVGALMIYTLTRDADTVIVQKVVRPTDEVLARSNPWADQGDAAIALVKRVRLKSPVEAPKRGQPEEEPTTVGEILENEEFVKDKLKITNAQVVGWQSTWWGETRFGPSYFLVRHSFADESILVGPTWLVDIRSQKVVAKNVLANVVSDPQQGIKSDYYDKAQQVVSAITNHRFTSEINLAGALLLYFEQTSEGEEEDTILGWTIDHERGNLFRAYFQWVEEGEQTYAEFEFDFDARALRPINLQAAQIMRVGEDFETTERVSIMPGSYDPKERVAARRWLGDTRRVCRSAQHRDGCRALAALLDQSELIESLEWLLTAQANTAEEFEECKQARKCRWNPEPTGDKTYRVNYIYNLGKSEQTITWEVVLGKDEVKPVDRVSELAYRAIHSRS
ncbi:MAG: hypothetical protein ACNA8W_11895 [Bradymonadaceae bacterium]